MANLLAAVAVNGLVTFILVLMLKDLDGPGDLFVWARTWLMKSKMMDLWLNCPWCMSTWFSLPLAVYTTAFALEWWMLPLLWLGAVTLSGFIYNLLELIG